MEQILESQCRRRIIPGLLSVALGIALWFVLAYALPGEPDEPVYFSLRCDKQGPDAIPCTFKPPGN